ncbi:MAG: hypothetical protein JWM32_1835 [Verrucomicrobia bacterium]|nr:hypothetical protein [Verrucomicrobiota bacterium]
MQKRFVGLILVIALGVAAGYWWTGRSAKTKLPSPAAVAASTSPTVDQIAPGKTAATLTPAKPFETIQDGKTVDFSNGKAVVKESADDKAVIAAAVKEMDDATKNITFGPLPPAKPAPTK